MLKRLNGNSMFMSPPIWRYVILIGWFFPDNFLPVELSFWSIPGRFLHKPAKRVILSCTNLWYEWVKGIITWRYSCGFDWWFGDVFPNYTWENKNGKQMIQSWCYKHTVYGDDMVLDQDGQNLSDQTNFGWLLQMKWYNI